MADSWRDFDVAAYNEKLELSRGQPYRLVAQEARAAARVPKLLESDVLPAVLKLLRLHPKVAWAQRFNSGGAYTADGRYIQYAFTGCSDILGQLKDGRLLAVEVKRPGGMPTPAQVQFLAVVEQNGGVALVARGIEDVERALG